MSEKKSQDPQGANPKREMKSEPKTSDKEKAQKPPTTVPVEVPATHVVNVPVFTKTSPNDLYRRLLPAVLFVLTFVTVMTMLLVYMDTVALGAQQFRLNMSRDYELARIPADSAPLLAYVRQLQLAARPPAPLQPVPTRSVGALDRVLGVKNNGTFVEILWNGPRDQSTQYLETARGWRGLAARAAPRDFLGLRGPPALHACLSATPHPAEISYHGSTEEGAGGFSSRVLCLPLLTVLLAAPSPAPAPAPDYLLLGGPRAPPALKALPWERVYLKVIEFRSTDPVARNETTEILLKQNYTVLQEFDDAIMYNLKDL